MTGDILTNQLHYDLIAVQKRLDAKCAEVEMLEQKIRELTPVVAEPDRMSAKHRAACERDLAAEMKRFLDGVEECSPSLEDGEEHTVTIRAGRVSYEDDNTPLYQLLVKRTQESLL